MLKDKVQTVLLLNDPIGSKPMINVQLDPARFVLRCLGKQDAWHMVNTSLKHPQTTTCSTYHVWLCSNHFKSNPVLPMGDGRGSSKTIVSLSLQATASPVFSGAGLVKSPLRWRGSRKIQNCNGPSVGLIADDCI